MSRYIDADGLIADMQERYCKPCKERKEDYNEVRCRACWVDDAMDEVDGFGDNGIDIVRCKECVYYDPPHVEDDGKRIEYKDLPKEAFDPLGTGLVNVSYGVNIGGRCCVDYNCGYAEDKRVYRAEDNFCSRGKREGADDE